MFHEIISGFFIGFFSSFVPGLHPNILSLYFKNHLQIISYSVSYTVAEIISLVYLSIPNDEYVLSLNPIQKYLRTGRAEEAIHLMLHGVIFGSLFFIPFLFIPIEGIYSFFRTYSFQLLFLISFFSVLSDGLPGLFLFLISGLYGVFTLGLPVNDNLKIFALLSGFFSLPQLIFLRAYEVRPQAGEVKEGKISSYIPPSLSGFISGSLTGFLPSLSASISSFFVSGLSDFRDRKFIISNSAVSASSLLFSFLILSEFGKARNGALIGVSLPKDVMFGAAFLSLSLSILGVYLVSRFISKYVKTLDFRRIKIFSIVFILLSTIFLGGPYLVLILLTSFFLGLFPSALEIKRTSLMGALIVPALVFLYNSGVF